MGLGIPCASMPHTMTGMRLCFRNGFAIWQVVVHAYMQWNPSWVACRRQYSYLLPSRLCYGARDVLVAVQHIQGIAIDAARSNVDHHYLYICDAYNSFMQTHTAQVKITFCFPCARSLFGAAVNCVYTAADITSRVRAHPGARSAAMLTVACSQLWNHE